MRTFISAFSLPWDLGAGFGLHDGDEEYKKLKIEGLKGLTISWSTNCSGIFSGLAGHLGSHVRGRFRVWSGAEILEEVQGRETHGYISTAFAHSGHVPE